MVISPVTSQNPKPASDCYICQTTTQFRAKKMHLRTNTSLNENHPDSVIYKQMPASSLVLSCLEASTLEAASLGPFCIFFVFVPYSAEG